MKYLYEIAMFIFNSITSIVEFVREKDVSIVEKKDQLLYIRDTILIFSILAFLILSVREILNFDTNYNLYIWFVIIASFVTYFMTKRFNYFQNNINYIRRVIMYMIKYQCVAFIYFSPILDKGGREMSIADSFNGIFSGEVYLKFTVLHGTIIGFITLIVAMVFNSFQFPGPIVGISHLKLRALQFIVGVLFFIIFVYPPNSLLYFINPD